MLVFERAVHNGTHHEVVDEFGGEIENAKEVLPDENNVVFADDWVQLVKPADKGDVEQRRNFHAAIL